MKFRWTFVIISLFILSCKHGYIKKDEKWTYVYWSEAAGTKIKPLTVDMNSFEILSNKEFAKDSSKVFFEGNLLQLADSKTFELLSDGFSRDYSKVFYKDKIIKFADSKSFTLLNDRYAIDNNHVFYFSTLVFGANPKTFQLLTYPYSKDDKTVYCSCLPMKVNDISSFRVIEKSNSLYGYIKLSHFFELNPEYRFIDTLGYEWIDYCDDGQAETKNEKFNGFKKIQ